MMLNAKVERYLDGVKTRVDKFGMAVVGCGNQAHSVGLAKHGFPDFIVNASDHPLCVFLLHLAFDNFVNNGFRYGRVSFNEGIKGRKLKQGDEVEVFIAPVSSVQAAAADIARVARAFYSAHPDYEVFSGTYAQVLWPDPDGLYPHEGGYDHRRYPQAIYDRDSLDSHLATRH
jgi:hypothetical protein